MGDAPGPQTQYSATSVLGNRVVYVNPVNMGVQTWDLYIKETRARLLAGEDVDNLVRLQSEPRRSDILTLHFFNSARTPRSALYPPGTARLRLPL